MSYANILKPIALGFRKASIRLTPFVFSMAGYAALLWAVYFSIFLYIEDNANRFTWLVLFRGLIISGFGILFTVLAALGFRFLESRVQRVGYRYALEGMYVLILSVVWRITELLFSVWVGLIDKTSASIFWGKNWVLIPLAGLSFGAVYLLRGIVSSKVEARRRRTFDLLPKALDTGGQLDAFDIIASLNELKRVYGKSRLGGEHFLEYLNYEIKLSLDPRYNFPMPLPIAIEFLLMELSFRRGTKHYNVKVNIKPKDSFPSTFVIEPEILCAAGAFIVEYGAYHGVKNMALHVNFRETAVPYIEIQTNIKSHDLWFTLDESSSAQKAKIQLFKVLNRYAYKEVIFTSTQNSKGCMVFQVSVHANLEREKIWEQVEQTLGENVHFIAQSTWAKDSGRTYGDENLIYKIQLIGRNYVKPLILAEEYNILQRLEDLEGVPQSPFFKQYPNFAMLSYHKIHGVPIKEYLTQHNFERRAWFYVIADLSNLMNSIHERGILHRDLSPNNILVRDDDERVCLIDFDQAVAGAHNAGQVDTTGRRFGSIPACVSIQRLIELLDLQDEYLTVSRELKSAWSMGAQSKASSPGRNLAYYHWTFGDVDLPGERDWFTRWNMVHKAIRDVLPGASILELGCNMGLMASHCALYGARHVTAVDVHKDILEAGSKLAKAAKLDIEFIHGDLNSHAFVDSLMERKYDVMMALSVLHWLKKPDDALRLLAHAPMLLFEGHDSPSAEMELLHNLGFKDVKLIGYSERLRGLYLATGRE